MTQPSATARINTQWSREIVIACLARGVDRFFVAPGSRSTPIAAVVGELPRHQVITHFDERGLSFACQGYGRAAGRAGAFICTSGTAVANAFPAVIEAAQEHVPMLLLTADRPPELRDVGANQAIRQPGIFGSYPVWSCDFPCPTADIDLRFVRSTIHYACEQSRRGPVHVNCMFREPLYDEALVSEQALSAIEPIQHEVTAEDDVNCDPIELAGGRTILIAGSGTRAQSLAAYSLANRLDAVFLEDVTSALHSRAMDLALIAQDLPSPDTVIHIGGRVVSQAWSRFISRRPPREYVHLSSHVDRIDPMHTSPRRIRLRSPAHLQKISLTTPCPTEFRNTWQRALDVAHDAVAAILGDDPSLSEPAVAYQIGELLPAGHALYLGNSMPIRDVDRFATWDRERDIVVGANRGASGIDGLIASATGFALGSQRPTTLVLGDLSFLHDVNSLALLSSSDIPVIAVVINNNGGGIFHFLPIAKQYTEFERMFVMPHYLNDLSHAARLFNSEYKAIDTKSAFREIYHAALQMGRSCVLEVHTDGRENAAVHYERLRSAIEQRLNA